MCSYPSRLPCYSSTNFLGQLAWYPIHVAWYPTPRDLGGYLGGFKVHHMQLCGFLPPISLYSPLCYSRHDYIELCLTIDAIWRNIMGVDMWEELSTSFWMIDRWAELAHAPQMCCFSPFLGVLSCLRSIN